MPIKLSDFDYCLPKEYIAQYPLEARDSSRLLILDRKKESILHKNFKGIIDYLEEGDTLVLNDTKVLPARLNARKATGGSLTILLLNNKEKSRFECLIRPKRFKIGEALAFAKQGISAVLNSHQEIEFNTENLDEIYNLGRMPLPPYIKRDAEDSDNLRYQTVYARENGSVASPTAGLHFTKELLDKIKSKGVDILYLTLHIGYSTFRPIKCENVSEHQMDDECFSIPRQALTALYEAKLKSRRIIAVGTSAARVLETIDLSRVAKTGLSGKTGIFIYPGYKFKVIDCLITNFHLSRTTPFMLVCSFADKRLILEAYKQALEKRYRFLSFGDSMFII